MTLGPWTTDLHIGEWGLPAGGAPVMVLRLHRHGRGMDAILHWQDRFPIVMPMPAVMAARRASRPPNWRSLISRSCAATPSPSSTYPACDHPAR